MRRHFLIALVAALAVAMAADTISQAQTQSAAPSTQGTATQDTSRTPISVAELRRALGEPVTVTATVAAVDYEKRIVVLRDKDGKDHALYVDQDIRRFADVKAGDSIRATYYMSLATRIVQPGETPTTGLTDRVVGTTGTNPGGTASAQQRWVVTVDAVDTTEKTLMVTGEQGRKFTFKVEDANRLAMVKAGDRIEVVLTAALLLSVEPQ